MKLQLLHMLNGSRSNRNYTTNPTACVLHVLVICAIISLSLISEILRRDFNSLVLHIFPLHSSNLQLVTDFSNVITLTQI